MSPRERANVLLIVPDSHRADAFGFDPLIKYGMRLDYSIPSDYVHRPGDD